MMEVPIWMVVTVSLALVVVSTMLWTVLRERRFRVRIPDLDCFEQALPSIAGMTQATIIQGNSVDILQNGDEFFPAFLSAMKAARETIHFETYVWWRGDICGKVAETLAERAKAGLEVRVMIDAVGSLKMDKKLIKLMRGAGVKVTRYHKLRLKDVGQLNKRTHRKLAIFDGKMAFVMGHGIARQWEGHGQGHPHWRDTGVRLHGPIVNAVQSVFSQHWVEETGEVLVGEKYFPHLDEAGKIPIHMLAGAPLGGVSGLELMFKMAIATAQKELIIQNPYFIPDEESVELLRKAVQRGVDVKVMIPGPYNDSILVRHAGHHHFGDLLRKGVRLFEHRKTLIHQKIMIIDGVWSHVGSTNLDDRSFDINEEAGVGIIDEGVAAKLREAFEKDLNNCIELKFDVWKKRPAWHRAFDAACYLVSGQL